MLFYERCFSFQSRQHTVILISSSNSLELRSWLTTARGNQCFAEGGILFAKCCFIVNEEILDWNSIIKQNERVNSYSFVATGLL